MKMVPIWPLVLHLTMLGGLDNVIYEWPFHYTTYKIHISWSTTNLISHNDQLYITSIFSSLSLKLLIAAPCFAPTSLVTEVTSLPLFFAYRYCFFIISYISSTTPSSMCYKVAISLRLEFHKAWKHGFKAQLLVWDTVLLHKICAVKKLDQTKSCALKMCFQASWNSSVKLEFHQDWKHGHGFKSNF